MSSTELIQITRSSQGLAFDVKWKPPQYACFKTFTKERLEAYGKAETRAKEETRTCVQHSEYRDRADMIRVKNRHKIEVGGRVRLERQRLLARSKLRLELRLRMAAKRREDELLQKKAAASKHFEAVKAKLSLHRERSATVMTVFGSGLALVPMHQVRINKARMQNKQKYMVAQRVLREKQITAVHRRRIFLQKMERAARQRHEEVEKKRMRAYHFCHAVQAKLLMFQERKVAAAGELMLSLQSKQICHTASRNALLANRSRLAARHNAAVRHKMQLAQWILIDRSEASSVPGPGACAVFEDSSAVLQIAKSQQGIAFEVKPDHPQSLGYKTRVQARLEAYAQVESQLQQGTKFATQESVYTVRAKKLRLQNRQKSEVVGQMHLERQKTLAEKKSHSELRVDMASARRERELAQKKGVAEKHNHKVDEQVCKSIPLRPFCMTPLGSLAPAVQERAEKAREKNRHKVEVLRRVQSLQEAIKLERRCRLKQQMQMAAEKRSEELNQISVAAASHFAAVKTQLSMQRERRAAFASAGKAFLACKSTKADSLRGALLAKRSWHAKCHNETVRNKLTRNCQLETDLENLHMLIMQESEPLVRQTVYQSRAMKVQALNRRKIEMVKRMRSHVAGMLADRQRGLQQRMQKASEQREVHLTLKRKAGPKHFVLVKARTMPSLSSWFARAMHVAFSTRKEFVRAPVCPDSHLMHLNLFSYQMHAARTSVQMGSETKI
eukprot:TRINITY_DN90322_c0_g1_i1.p1 TRINITY_DN90322_c0_g1~~TRINITY_DN90322_c0_g1_i1.p1  ORF type:complete len:752 (+),score=156.44 TRINITY_DN90322_c0_g1_i1:75-2258(+)